MADGTHLSGPWTRPEPLSLMIGGFVSGQFRMRKRYVLREGVVHEDGLEYQQRLPREQGSGYAEYTGSGIRITEAGREHLRSKGYEA